MTDWTRCAAGGRRRGLDERRRNRIRNCNLHRSVTRAVVALSSTPGWRDGKGTWWKLVKSVTPWSFIAVPRVNSYGLD